MPAQTRKATKAATPAQPKVKDTAASVSWDDLPEETEVTYTRNVVSTVDVAASTPQPIKDKVLAAYERTAAKGEAVYLLQQCGTVERAEEFIKLARRFAKAEGKTFRGGLLAGANLTFHITKGTLPATSKDFTVVSYAVKDAETKTRLNEAQKASIARLLAKDPTTANAETLAKEYAVSYATVSKIYIDATGKKLPRRSK